MLRFMQIKYYPNPKSLNVFLRGEGLCEAVTSPISGREFPIWCAHIFPQDGAVSTGMESR